ncbi:MAG: GPW/gp25 family protein [Burkholderiales bacterium]
MKAAHIAFPYHVDGRGRTAEAEDDDAHLRELIEQLLFTVPGERVNRPDFGCGLLQLVFAPNSAELAATLQALVQGALQQWLGHLMRIDEVSAASEDATLTVVVRYTVLRTQTSKIASFTQKVTS